MVVEPCRDAKATSGKRILVEFKALGYNSTLDQLPQAVPIKYLPQSTSFFSRLKYRNRICVIIIEYRSISQENIHSKHLHLFTKPNLSENQFQTSKSVSIMTTIGESSPCLGHDLVRTRSCSSRCARQTENSSEYFTK